MIVSAFRAHPDDTGRWFSPRARRVLVEHPEHITLVRGYINLLRSMGYSDIRGYVWYPARRLLKQV